MLDDDDAVVIEDKRRCKNILCDIKMSCARFNDEDFKEHAKVFNGGRSEGTYCTSFVLRAALGRGNPDMVFTEGRKRGRRHNAHAYTEPRKEFPGSEALFGAKLATAFRGKRRAHNHRKNGETVQSSNTPPTQKPDLMVTRHLRDGRNIKED